jgi:hypothetical protein
LSGKRRKKVVSFPATLSKPDLSCGPLHQSRLRHGESLTSALADFLASENGSKTRLLISLGIPVGCRESEFPPIPFAFRAEDSGALPVGLRLGCVAGSMGPHLSAD